MNNQTESYIVLKPIAERFSKVANEISDEEIKTMIKSVMQDRIANAIDFSPVTDLIENYIDEHSEEIAHATMDSIAKRLELPSGYTFY